MKPQDLIIGKKYRYKIEYPNKEYDLIVVKYLGDVTQTMPELGVTHCAKYLFVGSYRNVTPLDGEIADFVSVRVHSLAEFELHKLEEIEQKMPFEVISIVNNLPAVA